MVFPIALCGHAANASQKMPRRSKSSKQSENAEGNNNAVVFVSYQGPNRRTTAATKRVIHQQAMREIGKTRRKPKNEQSVELDLSPLKSSGGQMSPRPSLSWWLGVRWTLADNLSMVAQFTLELSDYEKMLIADSEK